MIYFLIQQGDCTSPELAGTILIVKKIFDLIELLAPITLLVILMINFISLVFTPEDKKKISKIKNPIIACILIFFIPMFTNVIMDIAGVNFSISKCWNDVDQVNNTPTYINPNEDKRSSILIDPSEYQNGVPNGNNKEEE